jgi:hypothetical protein
MASAAPARGHNVAAISAERDAKNTASAKAGKEPTGAPLIVYHDIIDEETDGDIEICIPIAGTFPAGNDVYSSELEGGLVCRDGASRSLRGDHTGVPHAH